MKISRIKINDATIFFERKIKIDKDHFSYELFNYFPTGDR